MWALEFPQTMGGGMEALLQIRHSTGESRTIGLRDEVIRDFPVSYTHLTLPTKA